MLSYLFHPVQLMFSYLVHSPISFSPTCFLPSISFVLPVSTVHFVGVAVRLQRRRIHLPRWFRTTYYWGVSTMNHGVGTSPENGVTVTVLEHLAIYDFTDVDERSVTPLDPDLGPSPS